MILELMRFSDNGESTKGLLFIDGVFECYTLEDEFRNIKVAGETRIPEGKYEIKFRNEDTPLTKSYQARYSFFTRHIEITGVPNFGNVYIHIGNTANDTDGCVLVGDSVNNNRLGIGNIGSSRQAFERMYKKVWKELSQGNKVTIDIKKIY